MQYIRRSKMMQTVTVRGFALIMKSAKAERAIMKDAIYKELQRWGWACPNCNEWNEMEEDPGYQETLVCTNCLGEFNPVKG